MHSMLLVMRKDPLRDCGAYGTYIPYTIDSAPLMSGPKWIAIRGASQWSLLYRTLANADPPPKKPTIYAHYCILVYIG